MIAPKLRFSEFKDEWFETTLNNLSNKIGDGLHATPKYDENGEIPFINGNNLINGKIVINESTKLINSDEFKKYNQKFSNNSIFLSINGTIGNIAFYNSESILLGKSVCFIDLSESSNKNLIYYILQSPVLISKFEKELTGTTIKNLSLATVRNTKFLLPNLKEQTKIAEFLSAVDDKISQLSRQLELLNQYKKGVMQKIFSQEIRFKNDNGEDFGEWDEKSLDEITEVVGGGTPSTSNQEYWDGEIVWLTPSEINRKYISKSKRTISIEGVNNSSAKILPKGTVLFTSRATIGEVAIAQNEVTTNQGFQSFIVKTDILNEFLYYWLIFNKNLFLERASGSTFLEVSKNSIKLMTISLPPFLEQQKIAEFLTAIDERIDHTTAQLNHTKQWKKGLLQQMFV